MSLAIGNGEAPTAMPALLSWLIQNERLKEAVQCMRHIQAGQNLSTVQAQYKRAKDDDLLEEALVLRKEVAKLEALLKSEDEIASWRQPSTAHPTEKAMRAQGMSSLIDRSLQEHGASSVVELAKKDLNKALPAASTRN